ncbi:MAG: ECF transporter S component [Actinomycetes bacterium]|jgi:riboflavin transporter FmnP|nr:ECF transporter S component [Actinomycetes bacterium]
MNGRIRMVVTCGLLIALAVVSSWFIKVPMVPSAPYLTWHPANVFVLFGTFAFGPIAGVIISIAAAILNGSSEGFIGVVMNGLAMTVLGFTCGLIYRLNKTRRGAVLALVVGSLVSTVVACAVNYFWSYPAYGLPPSAVWVTALPFNLMKSLLDGVIVFALYKYLSPLLHGREGFKAPTESDPRFL